jgi:hypothetical protein
VRALCAERTDLPPACSAHVCACAHCAVADPTEVLGWFYAWARPGGAVLVLDVLLDSATGNAGLNALREKDSQEHAHSDIFHGGFEASRMQAMLERAGFVQVKVLPRYTRVDLHGRDTPLFLATAVKPQ